MLLTITDGETTAASEDDAFVQPFITSEGATSRAVLGINSGGGSSYIDSGGNTSGDEFIHSIHGECVPPSHKLHLVSANTTFACCAHYEYTLSPSSQGTHFVFQPLLIISSGATAGMYGGVTVQPFVTEDELTSDEQDGASVQRSITGAGAVADVHSNAPMQPSSTGVAVGADAQDGARIQRSITGAGAVAGVHSNAPMQPFTKRNETTVDVRNGALVHSFITGAAIGTDAQGGARIQRSIASAGAATGAYSGAYVQPFITGDGTVNSLTLTAEDASPAEDFICVLGTSGETGSCTESVPEHSSSADDQDALIQISGQTLPWEVSDCADAGLFPCRTTGQFQLLLLQQRKLDDVLKGDTIQLHLSEWSSGSVVGKSHMCSTNTYHHPAISDGAPIQPNVTGVGDAVDAQGGARIQPFVAGTQLLSCSTHAQGDEPMQLYIIDTRNATDAQGGAHIQPYITGAGDAAGVHGGTTLRVDSGGAISTNAVPVCASCTAAMTAYDDTLGINSGGATSEVNSGGAASSTAIAAQAAQQPDQLQEPCRESIQVALHQMLTQVALRRELILVTLFLPTLHQVLLDWESIQVAPMVYSGRANGLFRSRQMELRNLK
jgi:hypothetical protein